MKRQSIEFIEVNKPILEPVTKFGGQPVWLTEPQWPLSAETGNPMRFICQIALDPELFGSISPRMAYIFMTDEEDFVDGTYEPDGGENAVILQPGTTSAPVKALTEGPSLYKMTEKELDETLSEIPCEFAIKTTLADDQGFVQQSERNEWTDDEDEEYVNSLVGNKIGGTPIFVQGDEFPDNGPWNMLLEIDSCEVPFYINFGDAGVGFAFISEDGTRGKFLWQCC